MLKRDPVAPSVSSVLVEQSHILQMCDVEEARAALRLGFLSLARALAGRPAAIVTVEGNQVGRSMGAQLPRFFLLLKS